MQNVTPSEWRLIDPDITWTFLYNFNDNVIPSSAIIFFLFLKTGPMSSGKTGPMFILFYTSANGIYVYLLTLLQAWPYGYLFHSSVKINGDLLFCMFEPKPRFTFLTAINLARCLFFACCVKPDCDIPFWLV